MVSSYNAATYPTLESVRDGSADVLSHREHLDLRDRSLERQPAGWLDGFNGSATAPMQLLMVIAAFFVLACLGVAWFGLDPSVKSHDDRAQITETSERRSAMPTATFPPTLAGPPRSP